MKYSKWSKDIEKFDLSDKLYIERANSKEFSIHFATYVIFPMNVWFRQSFDVYCSVLEDCESCFWIYKDNTKIGGVLIEPNYMNCLFLIPPCSDYEGVLINLKNILESWSDKDKDIIVGGVKPDQLKTYLRVGFRAGESRRCMIRPTERFNITWDYQYKIANPDKQDLENLTKLFYEAFSGGVGYQGKMNEEMHREELKQYFDNNSDNELLVKASSLIYERDSNLLIGACLVSLWEGWPNIYDIAVKPSHQGKKLATKMLQNALSILREKYPVARLFVTLGNDAELVYHKLGFLAGMETTEMYLPAKNK